MGRGLSAALLLEHVNRQNPTHTTRTTTYQVAVAEPHSSTRAAADHVCCTTGVAVRPAASSILSTTTTTIHQSLL